MLYEIYIWNFILIYLIAFDHHRVYKKTSSNQLLTLYLGSRELTARRGIIDSLKGVVYIDPKIMNGYKIYGQITLTFRLVFW